jgi:hypothetical protein
MWVRSVTAVPDNDLVEADIGNIDGPRNLTPGVCLAAPSVAYSKYRHSPGRRDNRTATRTVSRGPAPYPYSKSAKHAACRLEIVPLPHAAGLLRPARTATDKTDRQQQPDQLK